MRVAKLGDLCAQDIMSTRLVTTDPEETLSEVLGKMNDHDVQELPVVKRGKMVGLVNFDALIKRRSLPPTTKVSTLMTRNPSFIRKEESLPEVAQKFLETGVRAIIVLADNGELDGIITRADLINSIPKIEKLYAITVKEIMSMSPQSVSEDNSVEKAKALMSKLDVRVIPVVDSKGAVTGVIGLRDIAAVGVNISRRQSRGDVSGRKEKRPGESITVGLMMKSPAITVGPEDSVGRAVEIMSRNRISTLVVADQAGSLAGVLTQYDIIELVASFREERGVFVQITGVEGIDSGQYDIMYDQIHKTMRRINKLVTPKVFTIHVSVYHEGGSMSKFSLRSRLTTEHEMFYSKANEWDLFRALGEMLDQLENMIKKEKERHVDDRKKGVLKKFNRGST